MPFDPSILTAPLPGETLASMVGKLSLAALLGAVIGAEREYRRHDAGLRTHMLMSVAAAAFTMIAWGMYDEVRVASAGGSSNVDPIRVVEAVTAGVAFLGAGAIIQTRDRVRGVTTGAGMWTAGAIGVATGCGYYSTAISLTVIVFVVLTAIAWFSHRLPPDKPG